MTNPILLGTILFVGTTPDCIPLSEYLNRIHYWVIQTNQGEDAIDRIQQSDNFPDLILIGSVLSGINGFETAEYIKKHTKANDVPIIFLMFSDNIDERLRAFGIGALDCMIPPFNFKEIEMRIRVHLQSYQFKKALELKNSKLEEELQYRKDIQEKLNADLQSFRHSNESKNMLVGYLTHEIRNVVNGIVGINQLLLQSSLETKLKYWVNQIESSCTILLRLMNDVLDFSKLEAGKFGLCNAEFSLQNMITWVKEVLEPIAKQKKLTIHIEMQNNLPEYCIGDVVRIQQILLNLVSNAIKFTKVGKISIYVNLFERLNNKLLLKFSIQDTGVGIERKYQENLFQPFFQIISAHASQKGSGLGLTISKKLVEMMGGTIGFESIEEKGTTFWFTVLLEPCFWYKTSETISCENKVELSHYNLRILLVEDDAINQKVALLLLKNIGLTADIANNGREAFEILKIKNYDLILMDILMPEMDGIELTKNIRAGKCTNKIANIPIIAITANALQEDRERYLKIGMNDYVAKPIQIGELRHAILRQIHTMDISFQPKNIELEHEDIPLENKNSVSGNDDIILLNVPHKNPQIFNFDSFLERMGGDIEMCNSVLQYVPENLQKDLEILRENFLQKDISAILGQAHSIKGMMANISAERLQNIAFQIEYAAKNDDWQAMFTLLKKLEEEVKKFLQTLQQHLSKQIP